MMPDSRRTFSVRSFIVLACTLVLSCAPLFSQAFDVYDVDPSGLPTMRASFLMLDANSQAVTDLSASEITLTENGVPRPVTLVNCPTLPAPVRLSTVLTIDVSGSMEFFYLRAAKAAARAWIDALPNGNFECAITTFNHQNYFNQDFTGDKGKLRSAVDGLWASGGTSYDAAFLDPIAGGLRVIERAKYRRVLVVLTDGLSEGDRDRIIAEANRLNAIVYCVSLGMPMPDILRDIAEATGGEWFANVTTPEQAAAIYRRILLAELGFSGCAIEWQGLDDCVRDRTVVVTARGVTDTLHYTVPGALAPGLSATPPVLQFGAVVPPNQSDLQVTLTAAGRSITVSSATPIPASGRFTWISPAPPFTVSPGSPVQATVRFTPDGDGMISGRFRLATDCEDFTVYAAGGGDPTKVAEKTIRLVHPNGGEEFYVGDTVRLEWEGVAPDAEVGLEVSFNDGGTWQKIFDGAIGLRYPWVATRPPSRSMLARVSEPERNSGDGFVLRPGLSGNSAGNGLRIGPDGSIYVSGGTEGRMDFGGGIMLDNAGGWDAYVAKLQPDGTPLWGRLIGGLGHDNWRGIDVHDDGAAVTTGYYTYSLDLGGGITAPMYAADPTGGAIYVIKYDTDGNPLWLASGGGSAADRGNDASFTPGGDVVACGTFGIGFTFGGYSPPWTSNNDGFVAKLSGVGGSVQWLVPFGGAGDQTPENVAADAGGSSYVSGHFNGAMTVGSQSLAARGWEDSFLAKFTPNGGLVWLQHIGGTGWDAAYPVAVDAAGDVYVSGYFQGSFTIGGTTLTATGLGEFYLLKLDPNGNLIWARQSRGLDPNATIFYSNDISVDPLGNLKVTASVKGPAELEGRRIESDVNGHDFVVATFSPDGELLDLVHAKGPDDGHASGVATNLWGQTYLTGDLDGTYAFGKEGEVTADNDYEAYIWKIGGTARNIQSDESDALWSILLPEPRAIDVDLGRLRVGDERDSIVFTAIANEGTGTLRIDTVFIEGPNAADFAVVNGFEQFTIPEGTSAAVEYRFAPSAAGTREATAVYIVQGDTLRRRIVGEGIAPRLQLETPIIDFGVVQVGEAKDTIEVVLTNTGNAPAEISAVEFLGPNVTDFSAPDGLAPFRLEPGASRRMALRFAPGDSARTSGRLAFYDADLPDPLLLQLFGEGEPPRATLRVPSLHAAPGTTVEMPVYLRNADLLPDGVTGFEATLRFNASMIAIEGAQPSGTVTGESVGGGERVITISLPATPLRDSTLAIITIVAALGNDSLTSIAVVDPMLLGTSGVVRGVGGTFRVDSICFEGGARLLEVSTGAARYVAASPSPIRDRGTVRYAIDEAGHVTVRLVDAAGREVAEFANGHHVPGVYEAPIDASSLSSGLYHCEVVTPTGRMVGVVVVRK